MKPPNVTIPMQRIYMGRHRILLPAGVGDIYWTMVKFEAFCKRHKITDPYVATITGPEQFKGSLLRSTEFLEMIPFVKIDDPCTAEAHPISPTPKWLQDIYTEMWHGTRTSCPGFMGYDHFLVYNSVINNGRFLEEVDDLECNWYFPLTVSEEQERFKSQCQAKYGKYAVYLFSFCGGGYSESHINEFSAHNLAESIKRFTESSGITPVFVGAWYDAQWGNGHLNHLITSVPGSVNLVGQTSLDQLFGVIKGSELVVGCHCGPTIMAGVFRKKTIILWAKSYPYFNKNSTLAVCPPDTRETSYWPLFTDDLTVDKFVGKMREMSKC